MNVLTVRLSDKDADLAKVESLFVERPPFVATDTDQWIS